MVTPLQHRYSSSAALLLQHGPISRKYVRCPNTGPHPPTRRGRYVSNSTNVHAEVTLHLGLHLGKVGSNSLAGWLAGCYMSVVRGDYTPPGGPQSWGGRQGHINKQKREREGRVLESWAQR